MKGFAIKLPTSFPTTAMIRIDARSRGVLNRELTSKYKPILIKKKGTIKPRLTILRSFIILCSSLLSFIATCRITPAINAPKIVPNPRNSDIIAIERPMITTVINSATSDFSL